MAMASMVVAMAATVHARMPQPTGPTVRVTIRDLQRTPLPVLGMAKYVAAMEFAAIDVAVRFDAPSGQAADAVETIAIDIVATAPTSASRDALAEAAPYSVSGTRITIFYNRLAVITATAPGRLLGYVMAHEIAHVLERVARHSEGGILKAHWESSDYGRMGKFGLHFAVEDAELIRDNLQRTTVAAVGY